MKYINYYSSHSEYINPTATPNISYCELEDEIHYNPHTFADEYFTTIARENGTISFNIWLSMGTEYITSISYSTDSGETWTTTNNTNNKSEHLVIAVDVNEGDWVMWKGDAVQLGYYDEDDYDDGIASFFSSTCEFDVQGNVMSLLYGDNFKSETIIENEYAFYRLFSDYDGVKTCEIVNAKNLSLPATELTDYCYCYMFCNCGKLTAAPELPAIILAEGCYLSMFEYCTSLTIAPKLPVITLTNSCYSNMFYGCMSLTVAPELPATTLAEYCYSYMFYKCTSLTVAPELPATTLATGCYQGMFQGCTNLTTAPELPATTLIHGCYTTMFQNCTNLNSITCLATNIPTNNCTINWVNGVAASGTFTKAASMNSWTIDNNGIPINWNININSIYTTKYFTLATDDGNEGVFTINKPSLKSIDYSIDNGLTWTTTTEHVTSITANVVLIKSTDRTNEWSIQQGSNGIKCSVNFHVEGNIMSLLYGDNFTNKYVVPRYALTNLFSYSTNLTSAGNLMLTATTLDECCYYEMFYGCTSLTMVPELPATTLAKNCYESMFEYCTSLTTAPVLYATTLAESCYYRMFENCTNLITAPKLLAITLVKGCYSRMFYSCTSLTTAPELPATTLIRGCYLEMFKHCTNLNYIKCLALDIYVVDSTTSWVDGVSSNGTFIKRNPVTWTTGIDGIPANWTIQNV